MIKYYFVYPPAYKLLSTNKITRKFYRFLGNKIGDKLKRKRGLNKNYVNQGRKMVYLLRQYCNIKKSDNLLELGTGWIHWYSTFVRVFHNVEITLFDVWDNRQLNTLRQFISQLPEYLTEDEIKDFDQSIDVIKNVSDIKSFDELYNLLNYKYVIEKSGNLSCFSNSKFDIVFSCAVFEHINRNILSNYITDIIRILKPGGYSVQIIDIGDHYHYLDKKNTHFKEYLRISNKLWELYFKNNIHYINRLQSSEWLELFKNSGFKLIYKQQLYTDIDSLKISKEYKSFTNDDLKCHQLIVVHQKPFK